jgi:hypothetical protein
MTARRISFCPHCCNQAPQRLVHKQRYLEKAWSVSDGTETEHPWSTFVAVCETCGHLLLYDNPGDQVDDKDFHVCDLEFPKSGTLHTSVPDVVRKVYEEAWRIRVIAPNAFAVQIRRAVEVICEDRKAKKGPLAVRLADLAEKGELPPTLAETSDILRILGNIGAHGIDESIHPTQAHAIDEFFRAIVEYVYIAPHRVTQFKASAKKSRKSG